MADRKFDIFSSARYPKLIRYAYAVANSMEGKIFYITRQKFNELKKEYNHLVAFERTKVVGQEAPKILESEDLNPEFISFQEDMEALRTHIDELDDILEHHQIITLPPKENQGIVNLGAMVKVDVGGKTDEFMIVGTLEANPTLGKISNESPVGKALLGRKAGDEIVVSSPMKTAYKIKKITYEVS